MTANWMLYAGAAGVLAGVAALAAEHALRALRLPTRWAWAGAMLLTVALPAAAWLRPASAVPAPETTFAVEFAPAPGTAAAGAGADATAPAAALARAALRVPRQVDRALALLWAAASAAVVLGVAGLSAALLRRARRWRAAEIDGTPVRVSADSGPAVAGLLRGRIVVPEWVLRAPEDERRMIMAHECEHLRAGDHRLFAAALLVVAAMPWNPAAWWHLRRLRAAMEVDCDARVLRRVENAALYGRTLLEACRRGHRLPLAAAFIHPPNLLERRIEIMTHTHRRAPARIAALGLAACAGVLAACEMNPPSAPTPVEARQVYAAEDAPHGMQPAELSPREAVRHHFPEVIRDGLPEGESLLFLVSADGRVEEASRLGTALLPRSGDVETVEVINYPGGTVAPGKVTVTWIRLKAGADLSVRESGTGLAIAPARIRSRAGEDGERVAVLDRGEQGTGAGAGGAPSELVLVAPSVSGNTAAGGATTVTLSGQDSRRITVSGGVEGAVPAYAWTLEDAAGAEIARGDSGGAHALRDYQDRIDTITITTDPEGGPRHMRVRLKP